MWTTAPTAVQPAARYYFTATPTARTVLATPDGTLFHDDAAGRRWAAGHAQATATAVLRLTRAGQVLAYPGRPAAPAWWVRLKQLFTGRSAAL